MGRKNRASDETEHGTIVMECPEGKGLNSFTHAGEEWEVGKDGSLEIPVSLAPIAESHGWVRPAKKVEVAKPAGKK